MSRVQHDFFTRLRAYGELIVKVGINLRAGQRLLIIGPLANGGASLEAAPLVRHIAASAYRAGAPLVEVLWGDEALLLTRFEHAPRESFERFSAWLPRALVEHVEHGHAVLSVYANDPDLLKNRASGADRRAAAGDLTRGAAVPRTTSRATRSNWAVVAAAGHALGGESVSGSAAR